MLKRTLSQMTQSCVIFILFFTFAQPVAQSFPIQFPTGVSFAAGLGDPDELRGGRVALQWDWAEHWFADSVVDIRAYWDLSVAVWENDGDEKDHHRHRHLGAVAFGPFFRLQTTERFSEYFSPYLQAGVGVALLTHNHVGHRDLGKHWQFQDVFGGGVQFGPESAWDVGIHYLHYSNADFNPPNHGVDVKLLLMLTHCM